MSCARISANMRRISSAFGMVFPALFLGPSEQAPEHQRRLAESALELVQRRQIARDGNLAGSSGQGVGHFSWSMLSQ